MAENIKLEHRLGAVNLTLSEDPMIITVGVDANYVHIQNESSDTWIVTHNLGKYCSVNVVDDNDDIIYGEVEYNSENRLTVRFTEGTYLTGKVYCN
jgi:hypothetical protein